MLPPLVTRWAPSDRRVEEIRANTARTLELLEEREASEAGPAREISSAEEVSVRLEQREKELAAIGASIGANCRPCIEHHLPAGREAGLSASEILERRFAEGAISVEDYQQRREVIARGARGRKGTVGDD